METYTCTSGISLSPPLKTNIEMAKWLNNMEWKFYCTFTTKYSLSLKSARRLMERFYNLIKQTSAEVMLFWVAEPFELNNGYHLHALVSISNSSIAYLTKVWQIVSGGSGGKSYNYTSIKSFDKELGAAFYVSKYIMKTNSDYDIL